MNKKIFETELYEPVKKFFESEGYMVRGEVKGCDLTAVLGDELVIVEMKLDFNFKLLLQAAERQKITPNVFIAVPRPLKYNQKILRQKLSVLRRLGIGFITVALDSPVKCVDVVLGSGNIKSGNKKKKTSIMKEIGGRSLDANTGGSVRRKLSTAYREKAVKLACMMEANGALSIKQMQKYMDGQNIYGILQGNPYGWFDRVTRGIYQINCKCKTELELEELEPLVAYYRKFSINIDINDEGN